MQRYEHGGDIYGNRVLLDFSVNTNPLGLLEEVNQALVLRVDEFANYPDPKCRELTAAISRHENVPEDWILCGNGAADLIYRLCYAAKPKKALIPVPAFSEYERALSQAGARFLTHALSSENGFALTDGISDRLTPDLDVLFLCHPNNPTGRLIPPELMEKIMLRAHQNGILIVVDECFLDFTDGLSAKRYLLGHSNLVVLKAFTKMYSMAGLRLGYLLTSDGELLKRIDLAGQCWSVSVPAQIAGVAALGCDGWEERTRRLLSAERRFLSEGLAKLGIAVFPSDANFFLFRSEKPLYELLRQRGILIRPCENFEGLDGTYYRIGAKTRAENTRLIEAVKEIIHG